MTSVHEENCARDMYKYIVGLRTQNTHCPPFFKQLDWLQVLLLHFIFEWHPCFVVEVVGAVIVDLCDRVWSCESKPTQPTGACLLREPEQERTFHASCANEPHALIFFVKCGKFCRQLVRFTSRMRPELWT